MKPQMVKYGKEELMECIDVFNVSKETQAKIRELLEQEDPEPNAGVFFRYYNERSKVVEFEKQFAERWAFPTLSPSTPAPAR